MEDFTMISRMPTDNVDLKEKTSLICVKGP